MSALHRTAVSLAALAVACAPMAIGSSASAAVVSAPAASTAPCLSSVTDPTATRVAGGRTWHRDTHDVTQRDLDALPVAETRPGYVKREVEPRLPDSVRIPVYAHVIKGKHKGERPRIRKPRIQYSLNILNNSMAGRQSSLSTNARYRFYLAGVSYSRNDRWYHAFLNGPRDQQMKRRLHRGNARALNLYLNGGGTRQNGILGWSRFPWQYAGAPKLDGVSINVDALPGGRFRGYNLGDTLVHETGHWLGLFHTFQGGCDDPGDFVPDTPAEAEPAEGCVTTSDTCSSPGLDPVHNFMDYSLDSCMNMFTAGQVRRMDAAFEKWRF
ncbi:MAG: zinc metalloprotease [Marmoricola sp.]|nr:zinc metalloprotease [Marmoricola sp.]